MEEQQLHESTSKRLRQNEAYTPNNTNTWNNIPKLTLSGIDYYLLANDLYNIPPTTAKHVAMRLIIRCNDIYAFLYATATFL